MKMINFEWLEQDDFWVGMTLSSLCFFFGASVFFFLMICAYNQSITIPFQPFEYTNTMLADVLLRLAYLFSIVLRVIFLNGALLYSAFVFVFSRVFVKNTMGAFILAFAFFDIYVVIELVSFLVSRGIFGVVERNLDSWLGFFTFAFETLKLYAYAIVQQAQAFVKALLVAFKNFF